MIRLVGQPPVGGTCFQLERLRCALCGSVESAELPEEAGQEKFDPSVIGTLGVLHYGFGMPFNRMQDIQQAAGVPLPASTQWELLKSAAQAGLQAVQEQLVKDAAQGHLVYNDDTSARILELQARLAKGEPVHSQDPTRTGIFTTSILSEAEDRPTIALFFTGPNHAGENLRDVLLQRQTDLPPPIQMCDALSRNLPKNLETVVSNCLSHGRRKLYELHEQFPDQVLHVLLLLRTVYRADALARLFRLSPERRLLLHQRRSQPVMAKLREWLQQQFDERHVEPNSNLGRAFNYLLNHWEQLTLFLRVAGAPLDNNICERALKLAIRLRNNSLFYSTQRGAEVGDLYMSLIHTCYHAKVDPFDYLTQLHRHRQLVCQSPADWLPWKYQATITSLPETSSTADTAAAAAATATA